ncbi:tripartite tricarboxylate transporter substrate binding protein [soil metagenome]
MKARIMATAVALAGCFVLQPARAAEYPDKTITVVMPYAAGGATQALIERLSRTIQHDTGNAMIPDYRGGAGGTIAADMVANARPDGYTLLMGSTGALAVGPAVMKVRFDPVKDFVPIALIATTPYVMVVNSKLPIHTVKELVEYAKANPGKLNFGSSSVGSTDHIEWEVFQKMAGITSTHIPYKGMGPLLPDLISGRIDVAVMSPIPARPYIASGDFRPLGVTTKERSASMKDVPTIAEQGFPDYNMQAWYAFLAPAGTSPAMIDRLNKLTNKALRDKDMAEYLTTQGLTAGNGSPKEFASFLRGELALWEAAVRSNGIVASP